MRTVRTIGIAVITLFVLLVSPQYGFAKTTAKKKKMTVTVGADCGGGVLVSDGTSGNVLCAVYPQNALGMLREHVGQSIEIEALFLYSGDPKTTSPTGIRSITKVAGAKVNDPCSTGKLIMWGALAGFSGTPVAATGLPPGCAESLDTGAAPTEDGASAAPSGQETNAAMDASTSSTDDNTPVASSNLEIDAAADNQTVTATPQNAASSSARFTNGVPQCTRTEYENSNATLWIVNSCDIAVTVELTSDSGNTWGQRDVGPNNRTAATVFGIGYSPQKDGRVYLFTCTKGSQPVLPNGSPFLSRNYKGQFTCREQ